MILAGFGIEGASAAKLRAGLYKNRDGISGLDSKRRGILGLTPPVYPPILSKVCIPPRQMFDITLLTL